MPQYFFDVVSPSPCPDCEGFELPDIYAAQAAAVRLCGEMIREIDGNFWEEPVWRLEVKSHDLSLLYTFTFSAQEHDAPGKIVDSSVVCGPIGK